MTCHNCRIECKRHGKDRSRHRCFDRKSGPTESTDLAQRGLRSKAEIALVLPAATGNVPAAGAEGSDQAAISTGFFTYPAWIAQSAACVRFCTPILRISDLT